MITFIEKINTSGDPIKHGAKFSIVSGSAKPGMVTKSIYVRTGFKNGTLFVSQKGNGEGGAGDICRVTDDLEIEVGSNLFRRLKIWAEKYELI